MHHAPRILYIEDNALNRRLIRKLMKLHGFEYLEAEDGLQGVAVAARERPDLILMDIHLPGIDGMEATSRLKSSPDLSHIPIIALTAAAMHGDRERIMAAGCDGYLQKPIDPERVIATIRQYLDITTAPSDDQVERQSMPTPNPTSHRITVTTNSVAVNPSALSDTEVQADQHPPDPASEQARA